jgi:hypothetical protein
MIFEAEIVEKLFRRRLKPHHLTVSKANHLSAYRSFSEGEGKDVFHRKIRWFLSELFPGLTLDEQLHRVWLTEGRSCSIDNEIGNVKGYFYSWRNAGLWQTINHVLVGLERFDLHDMPGTLLAVRIGEGARDLHFRPAK